VKGEKTTKSPENLKTETGDSIILCFYWFLRTPYGKQLAAKIAAKR